MAELQYNNKTLTSKKGVSSVKKLTYKYIGELYIIDDVIEKQWDNVLE